ncbi:MAG: glycosyltransferase [Burkholderiales bacterium]|nr:glycosyltransferase [Burkholderiales bacterium]
MSAKPRLLFVSPRYLLPADSGGKIRTTNVLRGLKGGAFEVTLASPLPEGSDGTEPAEVRALCDRYAGWKSEPRGAAFQWTRLRHIASRLPIAVATDTTAAGAEAVARELAGRPDLVVVDFPHTAVIAPPPYPCASVLFTHNVEAEIFRRHVEVASNPVKRAVWSDQASKMQRFEHELLGRFTAVVAVAERDREYFAREYGAANVSVIPTGVDLDYFRHAGDEPAAAPDGGTVVFTGSMDWLANVDGVGYFMDDVWPAVARARPAAQCVIVGRSPPAVMVERARARGLKWRFTGFVDDVRPYVRDAHVYVIPLRVGGGTRLKVYEAMAMGRAVVSTRLGVEGLPVEPGRHYVQADAADAMAAAIAALLGDGARRAELAAQARRLVEENMSSLRAAKVFEEICLGALESARAKAVKTA